MLFVFQGDKEAPSFQVAWVKLVACLFQLLPQFFRFGAFFFACAYQLFVAADVVLNE